MFVFFRIFVYFTFSTLYWLLLSYSHIFALGPAGVPGPLHLDLFCIYPWKRDLLDMVYLLSCTFSKTYDFLASMERKPVIVSFFGSLRHQVVLSPC